MFDATRIIDRLHRFPQCLAAAVGGVDPEDLRWKPAPEHWSILEITCHLLDEEREDFRLRLRSTLEDPARPWAPLDLTGVAEARRYQERDLVHALIEFGMERDASVAWLKSLRDVDWSTAYIHPKVGPVAAGELLTAWAAHDALHLRQVAKRLFNLAERDGRPYPTRYAGDWTA